MSAILHLKPGVLPEEVVGRLTEWPDFAFSTEAEHVVVNLPNATSSRQSFGWDSLVLFGTDRRNAMIPNNLIDRLEDSVSGKVAPTAAITAPKEY